MAQTGSSQKDATTGESVVLIDKYEDDKIWKITMNRPHRMNSIGSGLGQALGNAFFDFVHSPTARVSVLTGAGERAFCAGADLKETADRRQAEARGETVAPPDPGSRSMVPLAEGLRCWKPTIAAINGFAIAGGFMFGMQCDIRLAVETARIGIAEVRWNMGGAGWMIPVTRQIALGHALELILWGDTQWSAQRAYDAGWVNQVYPTQEALQEGAMEWANRSLDMAPRAVRNDKQALYRGFGMSPDMGAAYGSALEQNLQGMKDSVEGPSAFAEKRRPNFLDA